MYRVLNVCKFSYNNFQVLPPYIASRQKTLRCCLCNEILEPKLFGGCALSTRTEYSSSVPLKAVTNEKKKKKNWRKTKYVELLEVSKERTSERKTKIKTLNASTLHKIQNEYSTDLPENSEMLKIQNEFGLDLPENEEILSHDESNVSGMSDLELIGSCSNQEYIDQESMSESVIYQNDDDISLPTEKNCMKNKENITLSKEHREKIARIKMTDLESHGKEKSLNASLVSYVELCVYSGFLNRGWLTVQYYLNSKHTSVSVTDVRVFNLLFEGYAKTGSIDKLTEVWKCMIDVAKICPNSTSFSRRFECIARSTKRDKADLLYSSLRMMESQGISCDDMFRETDWKRDSKEVVLSAVKVVRPNYQPKIIPPVVEYSCHLVNHLNEPPANPLVSPAESMYTFEELRNSFKEQVNLEKNTYVKIQSIDKPPEITEHIDFCRKQLEKLENSWEKSIHAALNRELSAMLTIQKNLHRSEAPMSIYPYLTVLQKTEYVDIIKHEIRKLAMGSENYSPTSSFLCRDIANLIKLRYDIKIKTIDGALDKVEKIYENYLRWYLNPTSNNGYNTRHAWQLLCNNCLEGPSIDTESEPWPNNVLTSIGKFLYNIILRDIKIDVNIMKPHSNTKNLLPAFYTVFRYQSNSAMEEVKPHPVLSRLYRAASSPYLVFPASDLPMLSPPVPWTSLKSGGYLIGRASLIRLPNSAIAQRERLKEVPQNQLYPCFDSLNQLGSIPWRVNTSILDIVINIFNSGGNDKLSIPPPPPPMPPPSEVTEETSKAEKYEAFKARLLARRKRAEMYSLWCDALYRLSLAHHFRDKVFWLPHNMDFRGRVYPCPPHLSHLGSDLYRSLLVFAKGQPLGPKGLDWLKIHAVNLTGLKKRESIAERLSFANENLANIIDSANNPMQEGAWWQASEEPWQTLATCFEIRNALNCPEGPEAFISSFPVHQDGSCNGLQHYAALGRDASGAASVNLSPSEVPQDVYSCVAAIVDRERGKDAANGVKIAQILEGFVRRKVIKQTVMTTVYGVTRFGARLQIAKQLKDIDDFPKEYVWSASQYLVVKTFDSIREMFTSTREIQDWFTEAAHLISGVRGESVEYVTPLGLPVVQPYSRSGSSKPQTPKNGKYSYHNKFDKFERPNVMKQKNAFPPNFIHSLDSTHMMLTSLHSQRAGITFVSVHDCFWTHPSTVDIMNKICREQFVALHSQPILQELSQFMINRYGFDDESSDNSLPQSIVRAKETLNTLLKNYPDRGNFELQSVLNSVYFFS